MANMNMPSQNNTNWYSSVDANWTSIETNLIDRNLLTAKGDLLAASASDALARVGVGADGQVLVVDSTQTAGIKWGDGNSAGAIHSSSVRAVTQQAMSSSTFGLLDSMSLSINVSSAQKVLAIFSCQLSVPAAGSGGVFIQILRGSTVLRQAATPGTGGRVSASSFTLVTLDQPGTGIFTYQVQWALGTPSFEVAITQDLNPYKANAGDRQLILVALPG
jgi:hypothetical protein